MIPTEEKTATLETLREYATNVLNIDPDCIYIEGIDGSDVYLLRKPEDIAAHLTQDVIVTGLSNENRYSGQTQKPYSVAEHSVYVGYIAHCMGEPIEVIRACIIHDISEAILGDIPSPLKRLLPHYYVVEENIMRAMLISLGLDYDIDYQPYERTVKWYDLMSLGLEMRAFNMKAYPSEIINIAEELHTGVEEFVKDFSFEGPYLVSPFVARGAFKVLLNAVLSGRNPFETKPPLRSAADFVKLQL